MVVSNTEISLIIKDKLQRLKQTDYPSMMYDMFYRNANRALYVEPFNTERKTFTECGFQFLGCFEVKQDNTFTIQYEPGVAN